MHDTFDLIVIGGGPAGTEAALSAASNGLKTVLIEKGELGGVCLNAGCIPLKSLLSGSKAFAMAHVRGFQTPTAQVMWTEMQKTKDAVVDRLRNVLTARLAAAGVEICRGTASFVTASQVSVRAADGSSATLTGKSVLVATGASSVLPAGVTLGPRVLDTTAAMRLARLPESVVIVGGGAAGCEFATLFSEMGVATTLVELASRLLPELDADLGRFAAKTLIGKGVQILTGVRFEAVREASSGIELIADGVARKAEALVVALGRRPYFDGLGFERAGLALAGNGGFAVDASMRTSAVSVSAAGDVIGSPMLAHVAAAEAKRAVSVIAGREKTPDEAAISSCVFTHPEIASVGIPEEKCRASGVPVRVFKASNLSNGYAHATGEMAGFVKIIADRDSGRMIGAHIAGSCASVMIGEAALAIATGMRARDFIQAVRPHPTYQETFGFAR